MLAASCCSRNRMPATPALCVENASIAGLPEGPAARSLCAACGAGGSCTTSPCSSNQLAAASTPVQSEHASELGRQAGQQRCNTC